MCRRCREKKGFHFTGGLFDFFFWCGLWMETHSICHEVITPETHKIWAIDRWVIFFLRRLLSFFFSWYFTTHFKRYIKNRNCHQALFASIYKNWKTDRIWHFFHSFPLCVGGSCGTYILCIERNIRRDINTNKGKRDSSDYYHLLCGSTHKKWLKSQKPQCESVKIMFFFGKRDSKAGWSNDFRIFGITDLWKGMIT